MRRRATVGVVAAGLVGLVAFVPHAGPVRSDRAPARAAAASPDGKLVMAVLSPERAMVADPRTGLTRERKLPGGTLCHGPVLTVAGRVIVGALEGQQSRAVSLPLDLRGPGRVLGRAEGFAIAGRRVWLASATAGPRPALELRAVDVRGGRPVRTAIRVPRWSTVEAVIGAGVIVAEPRGLALWSWTGRRAAFMRDSWLVAAGGDRFAWCRGDCTSLRLWHGGVTRVLQPPRPLRIQPGDSAGFSADGSRLALAVAAPGGRLRVAVAEPATRRWRLLPGARLGVYGALAWSPSGRWLYFADHRGRLHAWRVGDPRPRRLSVEPGGTVMSIAATGR